MSASVENKDQPTFTVAIRWRGPDPTVDLETRHPGFRDQAEAARFAAGTSSMSPIRLHLRPDGVSLSLGHGGRVDFPYDLFIVWIRPGTAAYESHPFSDLAGYPSACGDYRRVGYAVFGPGGSLVSMVIDFDNADRLSITTDGKGGSRSFATVQTPEASYRHADVPNPFWQAPAIISWPAMRHSRQGGRREGLRPEQGVVFVSRS